MLSWLGHAAMLITLPGMHILFDPCLSERCSPLSFAGPKRVHPVPCALTDLPPLDAIVISHNHYDHTDLPTLRQLVTENTTIFVPVGMKTLMDSEGFERVVECDWWDEYELSDSPIKASIGKFLLFL
jgi:L-ascorbate metabolism protein UlaG (beta-lactamase superfamily)